MFIHFPIEWPTWKSSTKNKTHQSTYPSPSATSMLEIPFPTWLDTPNNNTRDVLKLFIHSNSISFALLQTGLIDGICSIYCHRIKKKCVPVHFFLNVQSIGKIKISLKWYEINLFIDVWFYSDDSKGPYEEGEREGQVK